MTTTGTTTQTNAVSCQGSYGTCLPLAGAGMGENTTERKRLFHLVMFVAPISCLPKVTLQTAADRHFAWIMSGVWAL